MSRLWKKAATAGFAITAAGLGLSVFAAQAAFALGTVGTATPTGLAAGATQPSVTPFGLTLSPSTGHPVAFCSTASSAPGGLGDQEESYLVPATTSPTSLTFTGGNINGTGNYPLYQQSIGAPWPVTSTAASGQVVAVPTDFIFGGIFPSSIVLTGGATTQWNMGIACAAPPAGGGASTVTDYWNVLVTFSPSGTDANGYTWSYGSTVTTPESPLTVGLPLGGAAVLGAGIFINRRRRGAMTAHEAISA